MRVSCPDCRESVAVAGDDPLLDMQCTACGTGFSLSGDETLEYRSDESQVIGRFRLLEKAGAGAFGTVWKARDKDLGRTVAIKVPRQGQLDARGAGRFFREARTAGQLRHPNIVSVHEVGRHGESVYIVADYIAGRTLAEWLKERRPAAREVSGTRPTPCPARHRELSHGGPRRTPGNLRPLRGQPRRLPLVPQPPLPEVPDAGQGAQRRVPPKRPCIVGKRIGEQPVRRAT